MKLSVIIYPTEKGGFWAKVPAIPGCVTEGNSFEELLTNLYDAVDCCLSVMAEDAEIEEGGQRMEIVV